jgi:hypothetical protein
MSGFSWISAGFQLARSSLRRLFFQGFLELCVVSPITSTSRITRAPSHDVLLCTRARSSREGSLPGSQRARRRHRDGARQQPSMVLRRTVAAQGRRVTSQTSPQARLVEGDDCLAP